MSVGGTFALACAAYHPDRVSAVALVATPGRGAPDGPALDPRRPRRRTAGPGTPPRGRHLEENVDTVRPDFLAYRARVAPEDPDDAALAERWVAGLPEEDRSLLAARTPADLAADAREALLVPDGYLNDAALVFRRWPFDVAEVRCPVTLWYGERDANAPPRNGRWLADAPAGRDPARAAGPRPPREPAAGVARRAEQRRAARLTSGQSPSGPCSSSTLNAALVEHGDAELLGLLGLGAGVVADHDVVGLLRHRAGGLAAAGHDRLLGRVAGEVDQRAGDDDRQPLERARHGLVALVLHRSRRPRPTCRRSPRASRP